MEELQKQRDIADRANEAKSKFLANMSHEIRTPINAVLGMDEMILRESSEKPILGYATDIMSAGRTLLSLINDILDLSKIEEGKMEILPVQYDLSSLINDLVNMTRPRAMKKGLLFHVEAEEHVPHLLYGDEIRVRQCAMNILTNAVKYTEKGDVWLKISYEKTDEEHICLRFSVKDTGIGMKKEDMELLFSPYKRIEEERNRTIEGTGLGMSITKQLLDLMGSSLQVESEYGYGSVFSFEVSQKVIKWEELGDYTVRFDNATDRNQAYHELFHAPDARILVVDDTEMNLTVMQSLLKKTGIRIDTATSGREALVMAEQTRYDLVFIDHMMPEMDGIETLHHMRESGACKEVLAVALTANAVSGAREMYLEAGFADYLSKPVDGERLERLLADMLPAEKVLSPDTGASPEHSVEISTAAFDSDSEEALEHLMQHLREIPEIDEEAGLKNCGDMEGYANVLAVFYQTAAPKADEIEELYHNGDLPGYTIKVHALKSSARIIGATELSALAKALEDAGKDENTGFISEHTERLLSMYRNLNEKLRFLDPEKSDLADISPAELEEAYRTIIEIASSMDYGLLDDLLKDLRGYHLPEKDAERLRRMEALLTNLDFDGIAEIAAETEGNQRG
jgi:CheY-like chemotaxis protein/anti-sigma regulatory factor (Ser/Thr protein kinase)